MTKDTVGDWSTTAADNSDIAGIALGEGVMAINDTNNSFREMMKQIAVWAATPIITGLLTLQANSVSTVRAVAASAIDCATGHYFTKTAVGALTWTFTNAPATGLHYAFVLELTNGGLGTQTFPAGVDWDSATAPTLTSSGVDVLRFSTRDGGTTWLGAVLNTDVS